MEVSSHASRAKKVRQGGGEEERVAISRARSLLEGFGGMVVPGTAPCWCATNHGAFLEQLVAAKDAGKLWTFLEIRVIGEWTLRNRPRWRQEGVSGRSQVFDTGYHTTTTRQQGKPPSADTSGWFGRVPEWTDSQCRRKVEKAVPPGTAGQFVVGE